MTTEASGGVFQMDEIIQQIQTQEQKVREKFNSIDRTKMDVASMIGLQMEVNKLSQLCEALTSMAASLHQATSSMARNIK